MHTTQVITNGVDYIFLIVPVLVALFGWIGACYWADAHPEVRHVGRAPARAMTRGEAQAEATLAAGAADEHQPAEGERIAAEAQPERSESERPGQS
ncbi:MAG TPA: hypothetical protein VHU92_11470 [Streptosporangiaceae bacterium]|nr:hypothetical protein [Streptosporangiaceae bacterium]